MNARAQALTVTAERLEYRRCAALAWLAVAFWTLLAATGCRPAAALDPTPRATRATGATTGGTISGTVRRPEGTRPLDGRVVEVVNIESGERRRETTDRVGSFAFKVKPGRYRIELALQPGESLVRQPDVIELRHSDADVHADFVVGTVRVTRPRPSYRSDDGLGSPIA